MDLAKPVDADVQEIKKAAVSEPPAPGKEKKPLTEKQLAALAKATETRKRKREEKLAAETAQAKAKQDAEAAEAKRTADAEAKKAAAREKRRARAALKREEKQQQQQEQSPDSTSVSDVTAAVEEAVSELMLSKPDASADEPGKPKRQRVKKSGPAHGQDQVGESRPVSAKDDIEPPVWFKKYIQLVKKEESKTLRDGKQRKQVAREAEAAATAAWNDDVTRSRVRQETDNHLSRMYSMMFGDRRLK